MINPPVPVVNAPAPVVNAPAPGNHSPLPANPPVPTTSASARVFGGILALTLLGLYAGALSYMILRVYQRGSAGGLRASIPIHFAPGLVAVVTAAGGLVSALVVSRLANTTPGEDPSLVTISGTDAAGNPVQGGVISTVVWFFLGTWLAVGILALVFGVMVYPKLSSTVSDIGTTWLGLAVASGYAYFALNPKK